MSLNESIVEDAALEWFGEQTRCARALTPAYAAHPHPASPRGRGDGEEEVRKAIRRLNPAIPEEARDEALRKVLRVGTPSLTQTNRAFHRILRDGIFKIDPNSCD